MSLKTPLGRVLGLGTAGGAHHWWVQRVSAVALVPLGAWFVVALVRLPDLGYATLRAWLAQPAHAVLMLLVVALAAYHSRLGVQVVVEDYVHARGRKLAALLVNDYAHVVVAAAGLYAILRVAGGAP